jgi:hypothetical protein
VLFKANGLYTYKALTAGRNFNLLALACLATTVVIIDGPLLQRASTVRLTSAEVSVDLDVAITPELPSYWTGVVDSTYMPKFATLNLQLHLLPIYYDWVDNAPMRGEINNCPPRSTCRAVVLAPALQLDHCLTELNHQNFSLPMSASDLEKYEEGCDV